jgi:hypothetical protein
MTNWIFSDNTRYGWKTNPYSITTSAKGVHGTTIANIPARATIPDAQRRANALLIAAAPDLHDALVNLLAVCYDVEINDTTIRAVADARAALTKSGNIHYD